jgi:hypothetical protein
MLGWSGESKCVLGQSTRFRHGGNPVSTPRAWELTEGLGQQDGYTLVHPTRLGTDVLPELFSFAAAGPLPE